MCAQEPLLILPLSGEVDYKSHPPLPLPLQWSLCALLQLCLKAHAPAGAGLLHPHLASREVQLITDGLKSLFPFLRSVLCVCVWGRVVVVVNKIPHLV